MDKIGRLLVVVVFIAGCAPAPLVTPTSASLTQIPTTAAPPTRTPRPSVTPSPTPIPEDVLHQMEQVYGTILVVRAVADILSETAVREQAGELDSQDVQAIHAELASLGDEIEGWSQAVEAPAEYANELQSAREAMDDTQQVLYHWMAGDISPDEVIAAMDGVRQGCTKDLGFIEQTAPEVLEEDTTDPEASREEALAGLVDQWFEAMSRNPRPTQVATGCERGPQIKLGEEAGRIAFVSDRDGNAEIYTINADGSGVTRLTDNHAPDYHPAWSPDGQRIAFYSERDGNAEIYVMNADGSDQTRLTFTTAADYDPAWSPDGSMIAFHSHREAGAARIFTMTSQGSAPTRLTDPSFDDWSPDWSPDGRQIVFNSSRGSVRDIWVINIDGTGLTNLTNSPEDDWWPEWSPDGAYIAFHSERDGNLEIYIMNPDGSRPKRMTHDPANDYDPTWSPDSKYIAFTSDRNGNLEICALAVDGQGLVNITNYPSKDWGAAWRP